MIVSVRITGTETASTLVTQTAHAQQSYWLIGQILPIGRGEEIKRDTKPKLFIIYFSEHLRTNRIVPPQETIGGVPVEQ